MIPRLHGTSFDFLTWRAGSISDLGIPCRYEAIMEKQAIIKRYAVGWCYGGDVMCRPKPSEIAIMFLKDEDIFWFHLRKNEFEEIFEKLK